MGFFFQLSRDCNNDRDGMSHSVPVMVSYFVLALVHPVLVNTPLPILASPVGGCSVNVCILILNIYILQSSLPVSWERETPIHLTSHNAAKLL